MTAPDRDCTHSEGSATGARQRMEHRSELGEPSRSLYTSGRCVCERCLAVDRSYRRGRARAQVYGTWAPFVPAEPVREHLRLLRHGGASLAEIAASAGVAESALASIIYPNRTTGGLSTRVRSTTAEAVLAMRPVELTPTQVNRSATVRRLQVLVSLGWPYSVLGDRLGVSTDSIWQLTRGRGRVQSSTAAAVRALTEQIAGQPPAPGVDAHPTAISRALTAARTAGWLEEATPRKTRGKVNAQAGPGGTETRRV